MNALYCDSTKDVSISHRPDAVRDLLSNRNKKKKSSTRLNSPGLHVFFFPTEKNRNERNLLESPDVILSEVESTTVLSRHFCPKHLDVLIGRASLRVPDTLPLRLH